MASRTNKKKFGETNFGTKDGFGASMPRPREEYENPETSPLADFKPTGDLEPDSIREMETIHAKMIETRRKVDRKVKHAIDGSFYMNIVWLSSRDRDAFLRAIRMDRSVYRGYFLDGYQLARQLGLDIEYPDNEGG